MLASPRDIGEPAHKHWRVRRILSALVLLSAALLATVAAPADATVPTVTSVSPNSGPLAGGQSVLIKGTGFTGATGVKFDTVASTSIAIISDTEMVALVPANTAGSKLVEVTNATGPNTSGTTYKYVGPEVKKITPGWADPDTATIIVINGSGFTGTVASEVLFGTHAATDLWVLSDSQMVAKTPVSDTSAPATTINNGETDLTVTRNSIASTTDDKSKFLFTPGLPTITTLGTVATEVTGTDGAAVGTLMTITGTQLWGVKQVNFGKAKVTAAADIVIAAAGTSLTVKVPSSSNGPVDVTVENAAGDSLTGLKTRFNYYSSVAPKISSVSHNVFDKAVGGTFLVAGSGFTGVGTSQVTIKCATDLTPTAVNAVSDSSLIVTTPANAANAAGTCDLQIDNPLDNTKTTTSTGAIRFV